MHLTKPSSTDYDADLVQREMEMSNRPIDDGQAGDETEMGGVAGGNGEALAKSHAGDQHVYLADQLALRSEIGPDVRGQHRRLVRKREYPMHLAEDLEAGELCDRADSLQSTSDFVVVELAEDRLTELLDVQNGIGLDMRLTFLKESQRIGV